MSKGISVGSGTNIQDNSLVHVAKSNLSGKSSGTMKRMGSVGSESSNVPEEANRLRGSIYFSAHAADNAKPFYENEFEKVLRNKFARRDEEYDSNSMLGVARETPPELVLPDNVLSYKEHKSSLM
ncbi:gamma carbonic anhydrase 1, mitochondrial-like [Hibiscus syriacus]|uniref:gamma carbonic anhydrase 1, mitochondrial-like n=1 Tax=Hibiscus syriacus TaxID=106335 RepID=UPI00192108F0|nr:gamma carbonic anhydrase 1, mitochondrial-like [Hibiscus syriacus]